MGDRLASRYDLVVFDLDGVVYLGPRPVPGAAAAIRSVVESGVRVVYATNNAARGADEVARHLRSLDVPAEPGDVLTSAAAAATALARRLPAGAAVLVVGSQALRAEVATAGLTPVDAAADRPVAVVQGYGPDVGWRDLAEGCLALRAGAVWVATNTDATLPSERGFLPGNGSLVAALTTALGGRTPDVVVGKPAPTLFEEAAAARGAQRVLVVGDRLDTDIAGAVRAGMDSLLVLTGVSTPAELLRAPDTARPTFVGADCAALSAVDSSVRVPPYDGRRAEADGWTATATGTGGGAEHGDGAGAEHGDAYGDGAEQGLVLAGAGDPVAALRALAAVAWARPGWRVVRPDGQPAARAVAALSLDGPAVSAVSAGPAGPGSRP
jgi:HAD superfamily hydrolase (TIGR01450 family)